MITNIFKPSQVQKYSTIKACKVIARPILLYGSETWTLKGSDEKRIKSAEMKCLIRTGGYRFRDKVRSSKIRK